MLDILLINLVNHAREVERQKDLNLFNVITVLEEEKLELTKASLLFNRPVRSVAVTER